MDQICPLSFSVNIEFYEGLELNFKFYLVVSKWFRKGFRMNLILIWAFKKINIRDQQKLILYLNIYNKYMTN